MRKACFCCDKVGAGGTKNTLERDVVNYKILYQTFLVG